MLGDLGPIVKQALFDQPINLGFARNDRTFGKQQAPVLVVGIESERVADANLAGPHARLRRLLGRVVRLHPASTSAESLDQAWLLRRVGAGPTAA
jgi:hypothetical protein